MDSGFKESLIATAKDILGERWLLNQVNILKSLLFPRRISSTVLIELREARYMGNEKNVLMLESCMPLAPLFLSMQLLNIHALSRLFLDLQMSSENLKFPILLSLLLYFVRI